MPSLRHDEGDNIRSVGRNDHDEQQEEAELRRLQERVEGQDREPGELRAEEHVQEGLPQHLLVRPEELEHQQQQDEDGDEALEGEPDEA